MQNGLTLYFGLRLKHLLLPFKPAHIAPIFHNYSRLQVGLAASLFRLTLLQPMQHQVRPSITTKKLTESFSTVSGL